MKRHLSQVSFLCQCLESRCTEASWAWLEASAEKIKSSSKAEDLMPLISFCGRKIQERPSLEKGSFFIGNVKSENITSENDNDPIREIIHSLDWYLKDISTVDFARWSLIELYHQYHPDYFADTLKMVFEYGELKEQTGILRSLLLYRNAQFLFSIASLGVRTNAKDLFNAIALRNPYPMIYFEEHAWNQMVMKALFIGAQADQILGIAERMNGDLKIMLQDHIAEKTSAGRLYDPMIDDWLELN